MKYVKEFATAADYTAYVATDYPKPNVSYVVADGAMHYNSILPPPPIFCKLTLNNGEVVELEGSGELTYGMIESYSETCVSAEIGTLCTSIGEEAFAGCSSLSSITIPDGVTSIGGGAFQNCSSLTTVTLGSGITTINDGAFCGCESLDAASMAAISAINPTALECR